MLPPVYERDVDNDSSREPDQDQTRNGQLKHFYAPPHFSC